MPEVVQKEDSSEASVSPATPLLDVRGLKMHFPVKGGILMRERGKLKAVDGVDLRLCNGETLGLVGESGCGKSTLGKCIARLYQPTEGSIRFEGRDIARMSQHELKPLRRNIQMIFQDPAESLNSRLSVSDILEEPFAIHGIGRRSERRDMAATLLEQVGMETGALDRFPFEFSGGQRQRIGIARSLALNPKLIICDEPVSALDVSVQSQIINLLLDLQCEKGQAYLFVAHDLAVVKHISDRIAIMYLGRIVETADADEIFAHPTHAYTQALLASIPEPDPKAPPPKRILQGEVPSPIDPPPGCTFAPRSPLPHTAAQATVDPVWKELSPGHWVDVHPATVRNWEDLLDITETARFRV